MRFLYASCATIMVLLAIIAAGVWHVVLQPPHVTATTTARETIPVTVEALPPGEAEQWEYMVEGFYDVKLKQSLAKLGSDGWEIASCRRAVVSGSGAYECIFKRRK